MSAPDSATSAGGGSPPAVTPVKGPEEEVRYFFVKTTDLRDGHLAGDRPPGPLFAAITARQHVPSDHAPIGPDHGGLSGRHGRAGVCRGRGADRATAPGHSGTRVLQDVVLERRIDGHSGVLRYWAGSRLGGGRRPEPGADRHSADPPTSAATRDHGLEGADRHPHGHGVDVGRPPVGRRCPQQLLPDLHPGRDQSRAGYRTGPDLRRPAVRDAGESRPRPDGAPGVSRSPT